MFELGSGGQEANFTTGSAQTERSTSVSRISGIGMPASPGAILKFQLWPEGQRPHQLLQQEIDVIGSDLHSRRSLLRFRPR
jgi:hypothetical protein